MRRGGGVNGADALETISAAATAIAYAEDRGPQTSARKRSWGSCWNFYWCFGLSKNKRVGHVPESNASGADASTADNPSQSLSIALPFVAPPSSPASFLPSEPPSATQSPTGLLSLSVSASMYSPSGPASIFAIGPYAHERQLVSPPVFSSFTTEPSTPLFTPTPESVHLTTPSSPEVPFAQLLEPSLQNSEAVQRYPLFQYEFQSYQLQPGSPVSHLISPSSGISGSGTSSPFPDREIHAGHPFFLEFRTGNPPKLLELGQIVIRECESCQGSGAVTPDAAGSSSCNTFLFNRQNSGVSPPEMGKRSHDGEPEDDCRVSFEIAEEVIRCVEKKPAALTTSSPELVDNVACKEEKTIKMANASEFQSGETTQNKSTNDSMDSVKDPQHQKHRTITLGSAREFNFDNSDGEASMEWWVNEKAHNTEEGSADEKWSFFPMMPTGADPLKAVLEHFMTWHR